MALIQTGPLVTSISGSIGGANFYKHGPWQVVRRKAQPKKSTSYLRGLSQSAWSRAVADAQKRYTGAVKKRVDNATSRMTLSKLGIDYKLTGFQLLVNMNAISFFYWNQAAVIYTNASGMIPPLIMTVALWGPAWYIVIDYEAPPVVTPTLIFDWAYPISHMNAPKPAKFQYHDTRLIGGADQWKIIQGTRPRITGPTTLWWRARLITGSGEYSRRWYGYALHGNWP